MPDDRASRRLAAAIVRQHAGRAPRRLEAVGGGLSNRVYRAEGRNYAHIVRLHDDPGRLFDYRKEVWAMDQARQVDVPTARVLAVDIEDGRPFMLLDQVPGVPAQQWREPREVLRELAACAARLHTVGSGNTGHPSARAVPAISGRAGARSWMANCRWRRVSPRCRPMASCLPTGVARCWLSWNRCEAGAAGPCCTTGTSGSRT